MSKIEIHEDGLCGCSAADVCPLGRVGSQGRCTATELVKAGHTVEYRKLESFRDSRGIGVARPVRIFVKDDVLVQEFEIIDGPRTGQILTLRTRYEK